MANPHLDASSANRPLAGCRLNAAVYPPAHKSLLCTEFKKQRFIFESLNYKKTNLLFLDSFVQSKLRFAFLDQDCRALHSGVLQPLAATIFFSQPILRSGSGSSIAGSVFASACFALQLCATSNEKRRKQRRDCARSDTTSRANSQAPNQSTRFQVWVRSGRRLGRPNRPGSV